MGGKSGVVILLLHQVKSQQNQDVEHNKAKLDKS